MTDVMPRPKASPIGSAAQITEWSDSVPELDDVYTLKSYEQLENIINTWLSGDEEQQDDNSTGYTRSSNQTRSQPAPVAKRVPKKGDTSKNFGDEIDDAFADLESDPSFDTF